MSIDMKIFALILFILIPGISSAESVTVKYRGLVNLTPFSCNTVTRSSFIQRVCYDSAEQYMLINLSGIYYHYCEIPAETVSQLLGADSMGGYYNAAIKGRFDCRVNHMPAYR